MREAIQQMIEDYERRIQSASKLMAETTDTDQFHRVAGKHEAYVCVIRELKEVLSQSETGNPGNAAEPQRNDQCEQAE